MDSEFSDAEAGPGGEENAPVYCVCRKPDINCFMIGCDNCNEWFHGDCINITEKMAKAIREWYCLQCREKDPGLEIRYRHKKSREKEREHESAKAQELALEQGRAAKIKRSARMCGECEACRRPEDCGQCDFCRDMKKFGGPNKIRQKCRLRQCQLRARESYKYFPSSLVRGREGELELLKEQLGAAGPPESLSDEELPLDPRLYQELCAGAFDEHGLPWLSDPEDAPFLDPVLRKRAVKVKHVKRREKKSDKKEERYKRHRQKPRHRERSRHPERPDARDPAGLGQCLGPGCTRPARPPSKYCSEACGVKLAANRIYEILPQRIQQWQQSPCVAEEHGKRLLERIRREQHQARLRLQEMERRFHELEGLIARAKGHPPREDEETNDGDSEDTDLQIFCVSCGHPINPKVALRHMERCYAKPPVAAVREPDVLRVHVPHPHRGGHPAVLRRLQPPEQNLLQAPAGAVPRALAGPQGAGGRGVRVPAGARRLRADGRLLPRAQAQVQPPLLLGEAAPRRGRPGARPRVVQAGRAVRAGAQRARGHDEPRGAAGADAAPDHPARPPHHRPALRAMRGPPGAPPRRDGTPPPGRWGPPRGDGTPAHTGTPPGHRDLRTRPSSTTPSPPTCAPGDEGPPRAPPGATGPPPPPGQRDPPPGQRDPPRGDGAPPGATGPPPTPGPPPGHRDLQHHPLSTQLGSER
ncbi:CXXC-type zinc finger protein 1 isoform X2 [Anser cygnoides]|uniref:CXXC-type zinc finger protein 1 isoform X2 n=1 Tax=Anser cygnoides TaxID=8845 RepID=UPI0034D2B861